MSLPNFTASASLYRTSVSHRASDASIATDGLPRGTGVVAALDPRCYAWGTCCANTGSAYCCNHYYGICVNPADFLS